MIIHQPVVVGLTVCRDVTRHPSGDLTIHRSTTGMKFPSFPATATPFCVMATLIDGEGEGQMVLWVSKLDDPHLDAVPQRHRLVFHDRLHLLECVIRVPRCVFPSPGIYLFSLFLDGEWLAQRSIRITLSEELP